MLGFEVGEAVTIDGNQEQFYYYRGPLDHQGTKMAVVCSVNSGMQFSVDHERLGKVKKEPGDSKFLGDGSANVYTVETVDTGGGILNDIVQLRSGHVVVVTENAVWVYHSLEDYEVHANPSGSVDLD